MTLLLTLLNFHKKHQFRGPISKWILSIQKNTNAEDGYHLHNQMYFQWVQLLQPQIWKNKIKQNLTKNESNLPALNNHLIKNPNTRILTLDKLTAKEIYSILISSLKNKPISQSWKIVSKLKLWLEANLLVTTNNNH